MDVRAIFSDSFAFTRKVFLGDPARSIVFLLLGLSMGFFLSAKNIIPQPGHFRICWQIFYSWWVWGILLIVFWLTYTLFEGYQVRIFRGSAAPPSFDKGTCLIKEGVLAELLILILSLPAFVWMFVSTSLPVLIVLLALPALVYPVSLYLYANSGNVWDGLRLPKILSAVQKTGWGKYFAAWGIVVVCFLIVIAFNTALRIFLVLVPFVPALLAFSVKYGFFGYSLAFFHVLSTQIFTRVLKEAGENNRDGSPGRI
ncbi:MAG: DUF4013 domain-containing protein [Methanoregula sp.]|jgi:hypothetical protein